MKNNSTDAAESTRRSLFKRWWFWCGLLILIAVAWTSAGYFKWKGEMAKYDIQNASAKAYWSYLEKQSSDLEEAYKNDPYGGSTPDETLALFVEALEKGDYDLASKYFIVEKQDEFSSRVTESVSSGGMKAFIRAYRMGVVVLPPDANESGIYEIKIYESGNDTIPYGVRLIENKFTGKWKVESI